MSTTTTKTGTCGKCNGNGHISAFSHYANGTCFWCGGTGKLTVKAGVEECGNSQSVRSKRIELSFGTFDIYKQWAFFRAESEVVDGENGGIMYFEVDRAAKRVINVELCNRMKRFTTVAQATAELTAALRV